MRKTVILLTMMSTLLLSLQSCNKELDTTQTQTTTEARTILIEFDKGAKTTPTFNGDGETPKWKIGDVVRILGSLNYEDFTVENVPEDGKIRITVSLEGDLYAIYPASATTDESSDGSITFTIPSEQTGTFAEANICVAKCTKECTKEGEILKFKLRNACSVLKFTQDERTVKDLKVSAANAIAGKLTATFNDGGTIKSINTGELSGKFINVSAVEADTSYYVAVAPVTVAAMEYDYIKAPLEISAVNVEIKGGQLERSKIYKCPALDKKNGEPRTFGVKTGTCNGHSYVQVGFVKWATNNLAVSDSSGLKKWKGTGSDAVTAPLTGEPVVNGDYFQWAVYEGFTQPSQTIADKGLLIYNSFQNKYTINGATTNKMSFKDGKTSGFTGGPYSGNSKYTTTFKTILEKEDDAASILWGDPWRMPTKEEFEALLNTDTTHWEYDSTAYGKYVFKIGEDYSDKTKAILFFPLAGYYPSGVNYKHTDIANGRYWSSSLDNNNGNACCFSFDGTLSGNTRISGIPIRPVAD